MDIKAEKKITHWFKVSVSISSVMNIGYCRNNLSKEPSGLIFLSGKGQYSITKTFDLKLGLDFICLSYANLKLLGCFLLLFFWSAVQQGLRKKCSKKNAEPLSPTSIFQKYPPKS